MTNTKKRVFTGILLTIFLFVITLGFIAVAFPKKEQGIARADSVDINYSFHSSDTYYIGIYDNSGTSESSRYILFNGNTETRNGDVYSQLISYVCSYSGLYDNYQMINTLELFNRSWTTLATGSATDYFYLPQGQPLNMKCSVSNLDFYTHIYCVSGFNANVYKITLGLSDTDDWDTNVRPDGLKYFNIYYYDVNDNYIRFSFLVSSTFWYNTRTYYLVSNDNLTESQQYNAGYQQGLIDNQQNVYNNGYSAGRTTGYNLGYTAGVTNANNYSFIGLLGAVIDVPVNAFNSLFDFTVLGVNLRTFILGLLSFAVLLTIWKWIKGGR